MSGLILPPDVAKNAKPWRPGALNTGAAAAPPMSRTTAPAAAAPAAANPSGPESAQASQLAALRNRALREGYEQGFATGERAVQEAAERLTELAQSAGEAFSTLENDLAAQLLDLAVAIARHSLASMLLSSLGSASVAWASAGRRAISSVAPLSARNAASSAATTRPSSTAPTAASS